jgi:hypothetical protein
MSEGEADREAREVEHKVLPPSRVPEALEQSPVHDPLAPVQRLASSIGNQNFTTVVARMAEGEGILDGGCVHPHVEAAIAASRGGGRPLDRALGQTLGGSYGDDFGDVRVHTGPQAASLARAVSARAFTVGSDIYFAPGEYEPASRRGQELIAHEVAHVTQQRGAPASGPLVVSQPGDALERDADAAARDAIA